MILLGILGTFLGLYLSRAAVWSACDEIQALDKRRDGLADGAGVVGFNHFDSASNSGRAQDHVQ